MSFLSSYYSVLSIMEYILIKKNFFKLIISQSNSKGTKDIMNYRYLGFILIFGKTNTVM